MEVIALKSPEDWEWRSKFVADVQAAPDALERIVGKYDLPRPPPGSPIGTGMVLCGLNNCHRKHFIGFLILLKDGRETIIGQDCGARDLHTSWKDVEARFRAEERHLAVQQAIQALLEARDSYIKRANDLWPQCETRSQGVSSVANDLHRFQGFWQQLYAVARQGGQVQGRTENDGQVKKSGGSEVRTTVEIIDDVGLLLNDTSEFHRALQFKVVHWLRNELDAEISRANGDLKQLGAIARRSGELESCLRDAEDFLQRAARFLRRENLAKFAAIEEHMLSRTHRSNALSRVLKRLPVRGS